MFRRLWIVLVLLLLAGCGSGETVPPPDSADLTLDVIQAYHALVALDDLEARDVLDETTAATQRDYYLGVASEELGQSVTRAQLTDLVFEENQGWWRFVTFVNIIWLFASLMIVLAFAYIFAHYILPLLFMIPVTVYELLLYTACFGLLYIAWDRFEPDIGQFVAMPALLGLLPLVTWSYERHVVNRRRRRPTPPPDGDPPRPRRRFANYRLPLLLQHSAMLGVYVVASLVFESELIGFFAVVEALVVIGLAGVPELIAGLLRMKLHDAIEEIGLIVSLALVMFYIVGETIGADGAYLLFEPAVFYIGTYIYFTLLAVVASRYYRRERTRFWFWQIAAVVSGIGALFVGVMLEIDTMQESGGTFLLVYMIEKYVEMLNWKRHWAWAMLGLGLLLYGIALLINQYPGYFLMG